MTTANLNARFTLYATLKNHAAEIALLKHPTPEQLVHAQLCLDVAKETRRANTWMQENIHHPLATLLIAVTKEEKEKEEKEKAEEMARKTRDLMKLVAAARAREPSAAPRKMERR